MARIYLDDTSHDYVIGNNSTEVYGTGSRKDSIILNGEVNNIDITSTIEFVTLQNPLSEYKFSQGFGSNLEIFDNEGTLIAKMGSVDGKAINIEGEEFKIDYKGGIVSIGGNKLSTEPTAIESSVSSEYNIINNGITIASDENSEVFIIESGSSYSHKINNFDIFNDKLKFGDGIEAKDLTLKNSADDGKVYLEYTPDMGSTIVKIELTGLDLKSDKLLTTDDGLNNILYGYVPPIDDGGGKTSNDDTVNTVSIGDAGDTVKEATSIELDSTIKGFADDNDNYSFIATSDSVVSVDLYAMNLNLDLFIYKNEELIDQSVNNGNTSENISFDVKEGETYTIGVNKNTDEETSSTEGGESIDDGEEASIPTNYNLYAWLKDVDSKSDKSDDELYDFEEDIFISIGDAGEGSDSTLITLNGSDGEGRARGLASDNDDYKFVATQSGTLKVSLSGMNEDLDLELIDAKGESLAESHYIGTKEENIEYEVHEGETYIVNIEIRDSESNYDLYMCIA
jgi:hypothetical protein